MMAAAPTTRGSRQLPLTFSADLSRVRADAISERAFAVSSLHGCQPGLPQVPSPQEEAFWGWSNEEDVSDDCLHLLLEDEAIF